MRITQHIAHQQASRTQHTGKAPTSKRNHQAHHAPQHSCGVGCALAVGMDWGDDDDDEYDDIEKEGSGSTDLIRISSICALRASTSTFTGVQMCGLQSLTATAAQVIGVKIVGVKALSV
jgi:hypothetical protein